MLDKRKIKILQDTITFLERENENLKRQLNDLPEIRQTLCDLKIAKEEYNKLTEELKNEIEEYKIINNEMALLKRNFQKEMTKEIKKINKFTK